MSTPVAAFGGALEETKKTEEDHLTVARERLLDAALGHTAFDGWSAQTFEAAIADSGVEPALAHQSCPRGSIDLALAFHRRGDAEMVARLESADLAALRYSERISSGVRFRLEASTAHKETVRRGVAYFALPAHAGEGAAAVWGTCDLIWNTLGDTSRDLNWYTKRATLAAVYSSTLLFWLGDQSDGHTATWEFLDRRIANVMSFEKFKAGVRKNPIFQKAMKGPGQILDRIHAPDDRNKKDLPGYVPGKR